MIYTHNEIVNFERERERDWLYGCIEQEKVAMLSKVKKSNNTYDVVDGSA